MEKKTLQRITFTEQKNMVSSLMKLSKKFSLLLVLLFATYFAQAQGNVYHHDDKGVIRIIYEGRQDGVLHFRVILDNKKENTSHLKIISGSTGVLFDGLYKTKEVIQRFKIDSPNDNSFIFQIQRTGDVRPVGFAVNLSSFHSENVLIKPLSAKL